MLGLFEAKNEICDVYRRSGAQIVLVKQPRREGHFDRSNTTSGFLLCYHYFEDRLHARVALMPPLGATNDGLVSYLAAHKEEGIEVDTLSLGVLKESEQIRILAAISLDHHISVAASAKARYEKFDQVRKYVTDVYHASLGLVALAKDGDQMLEHVFAYLREKQLLREETHRGLKIAVEAMMNVGVPINRRGLMSSIETEIKSPLVQPA